MSQETPLRALLPEIFERTLSLDRGGSGFSDKALSLWERMADTLDKIAANTSGGSIQGSEGQQTARQTNIVDVPFTAIRRRGRRKNIRALE